MEITERIESFKNELRKYGVSVYSHSVVDDTVVSFWAEKNKFVGSITIDFSKDVDAKKIAELIDTQFKGLKRIRVKGANNHANTL